MDHRRFDDLARSLAAATPRRRVLRGLAGGALGGLLGLRRADDAAAACLRVPKPCAADPDCCTGSTCEGDGRCAKAGRPTGNCRCKCKPGLKNCDGRCRNLKTDERNCGGCGAQDPAFVCAAGESCEDGQCVCRPDCAGKQCGGDGCGGSCGPCGAGQACQAGACVSTCKAVGSTCATEAECCQDGGGLLCDFNRHGSGVTQCGTNTSTRCCRGGGSPCSGNCDCCIGRDCISGTCARTCKELRAPCAARGECCDGAFCATNKHNDGTVAECGSNVTTVCCQGFDGTCGSACDCCRGFDCVGGRCSCPAGTRICNGGCIPTANCCGDGDCGGGNVCRNGACVCPNGTRRCGNACLADDACCTDDDCNGNACDNTRCLPCPRGTNYLCDPHATDFQCACCPITSSAYCRPVCCGPTQRCGSLGCVGQ